MSGLKSDGSGMPSSIETGPVADPLLSVGTISPVDGSSFPISLRLLRGWRFSLSQYDVDS